MGAFNGTRRKATEGLVLYTNQLYHKSFPGEPTKNLAPTAERESDFDVGLGGATHNFYRIYKDKDPDQQGMYNSFVSGSMSNSDVVYKYAFPDISTNNNLSKHGFRYFSLDIGSEYILSAEVFVSKKHTRETGSNWPVLSAQAIDQPSEYGYYDFSKKGTWQTVNVAINPSLLKPETSTSGTSGTAGTAGTSGVIKKAISYAIYMWPSATCPIDKYGSGYIIYKNLQLEKNTHRTQFIKGNSQSRVASKGLKDLSGNNNSFNITRLPFDNDAQPTLGKPSSYFDIGLTGGLSSAFSVGSTKTKTYEFWVKLDLSDSRQSTLFYSDVSKSNQFVSNNNISKKQHIYILNNRVYCDIYNANSTSTSYFSEKKEITSNSVHHILVSVDMNLSQSKVKIFVDGFRVPSVSTAALIPPGSITAKIWPLERPSISNVFKIGSKINYKISSVNENGESVASRMISAIIKNSNSSITLSWINIPEASKFLIYRSINSLGEFGNSSLLGQYSNSLVGTNPTGYLSFLDDGSSFTTSGSPKDSSFANYSNSKISYYDGPSMKVAIGSYPRADALNKKIYSSGNIYKVSIYKKAFGADQALSSYIQGLEDFDLNDNTTVSSGFSASAASVGGGY